MQVSWRRFAQAAMIGSGALVPVGVSAGRVV